MRAFANPEIEEILAADGKAIVFVHVGKCAGEAAIDFLCRQLDDSFVLFEMHVQGADQKISQIVSKHPNRFEFLVAARDPISRFVSAFNWDKHNLYLSQTSPDRQTKELFETFPSVEALALGLSSESETISRKANSLSRFAHMGMGQAFYTSVDVLECIPRSNLNVYDVKSIASDLGDFVEKMTGRAPDRSPKFFKSKDQYSKNYKNGESIFSTFLSELGKCSLSSVIEDDLWVYEWLTKHRLDASVRGFDLSAGIKNNIPMWVNSPYYEGAEKWTDIFWSSCSKFYNLFNKLDHGLVIDLAAGHGRHAERAAAFADELILVDIAEQNLEISRARLAGRSNVDFELGDGISFTGILENSVDGIYCYDSMVGFSPAVVRSYLFDTARVLKSGGRALYHHSNYAGERKERSNAPHGRSYMTKEIFSSLAAEAGLNVLEQHVIDWGGVSELDCVTLLAK